MKPSKNSQRTQYVDTVEAYDKWADVSTYCSPNPLKTLIHLERPAYPMTKETNTYIVHIQHMTVWPT